MSIDPIPQLKPNDRTVCKDQYVAADLQEVCYGNHLFLRLVAKEKNFAKVDFKYTIFDTCYFRKCLFDSCDFTGCRFAATNLIGSTFIGCTFDYAIFERTLVDSSLLDSSCPGRENLRKGFARSLRMNFQQLGDAKAANKALRVELLATQEHLWKSWASKESYYRKKYAGIRRVYQFLEWLEFRALDRLWGNGESAWTLLRSVVAVIVFLTILDVFALKARDAHFVMSYIQSFGDMSAVFLGVSKRTDIPQSWLTALTLVRFVALGAFVSIVVKKYNRR